MNHRIQDLERRLEYLEELIDKMKDEHQIFENEMECKLEKIEKTLNGGE